MSQHEIPSRDFGRLEGLVASLVDAVNAFRDDNQKIKDRLDHLEARTNRWAGGLAALILLSQFATPLIYSWLQ